MSDPKRSNMTRREFMRLASLAGGAALLGACVPVQPTAAPQATEAPQAAAPTAAPAAGKKYEGVVLRGLGQGGTAYEPFLKVIAQEFEAATGAKIELDGQPWEQLMPKLQADLSSGQPNYDFFWGDIEFQYPTYPYLLPINDMITKYNYDMEGFFEPVYKYGEGVVGGLAGVRFGLPIRVGACWVFYRTDLIDQFPTTWADYETMLKDLTSGSQYGVAFAGVAAQLVKIFLARYWSQGDPLMTTDWKPLINSEKGVKAADMMLTAVKNYAPPGMLGWDNPDASQAFLNGDVAVLEGWASFILPDLDNPDKSKISGKWSVAQFPEKGSGNFTQHNMIIMEKSPNPDAAFEYIAACTGPENAKRLLMEFGEESPRKSIWSDSDVLAQKPFLTAVAAGYENAKPFTPGVPQWLEMFIGLAEGLSAAMSEQESPQQALDNVAQKWTDLIAQAKPAWEYKE
jgi:multiple sugar transport system substrate-binding protein